ncbi:Hpt domain-containing protein [Arthrobacter sp. AK01]|uniref:Hpt domain-containing protein n=1 Tax=Micrococcaceae TaxID=1268 RepID=UPI001E32DF46|nr:MULTISPECIES: Hpt domain-containing protein [Micrococcaceae]MCD4853069.1 Hpt domain-containing protein [Arthrobacter sp. AK01]MCP1411372.1 HPt (histidine-containing phosphotransfer) domain-containing protein [Paenarthrobacter sp. A20]
MTDEADPVQAPEPSVLEPCRLQSLADELGDSTPAIRFLSTYLSMLPGRILRISNGLCRHDPDASMDAVLSLKISSAMVGALETENQCRAMETMIREDHFDSAVQALPELQKSTDRCFAAGPQLLSKAQESLCKRPQVWPKG